MCGIVGIFNAEKNHSLQNVVDGLKHRGPDEQFHIQKTTKYGYAAFGTTRLAIVNRQMTIKPNVNSKKMVILNGEIWNYKALQNKLELGEKAVSEQTVILAAYNKWGTAFTQYIDGMYAIAIIDLDNNQFVLARDPMGIKPLFYMKFKEGFAFASDIKSLVQMKIKPIKTLNHAYFLNNFAFKFSDSHDTILPSIHELPASTVMTYAFESMEIKMMGFDVKKIIEGLSTIKESKTFEKRLSQSILKQCMHSDATTIGLLLSGGVDSSLIAILARKLKIKNIVCFFVGSKESPDYKWAKKVAKIAHYQFHQIHIETDEVIENISDICYHRPGSHPGSHIYLAFKKIHELFPEMKVVLCGEGADEILGGYPIFRKSFEYINRIKEKLILSGSNTTLAQKFWSLAKDINTSQQAISVLFSLMGKEALLQSHLTPFDHFSMAHGIEVRVPYLDISLAHKIPKKEILSHVINNTQKCWIKDLLMKNAPSLDETFYTRKKTGFPNVITNIENKMIKKLYFNYEQKINLDENWMLNPLSKIWVENCYMLYCTHKAKKIDLLKEHMQRTNQLTNTNICKFNPIDPPPYSDKDQVHNSIKSGFPLSANLRTKSFFLILNKFVNTNKEKNNEIIPHHLFKRFVVYAHRQKNILDSFGKDLLRYEYYTTCITNFPGFQTHKPANGLKKPKSPDRFEINPHVKVKKFNYDFAAIQEQFDQEKK
ncbi:MAG: asparagine synthase (glutamine-hydrolyzing) [Actinobacteria bacterium]|nr:asparagine synthase (glutamine-hydrolyzing) [Actinomycetota bacterium]